MMKGVSPLLAAVMLIAVTVGIGTLIAGFVSTTFRSTEVTVTNKTTESVECVNAEIVIDDVYSKVGDNGTTVAVLRNSGFTDDLTITSAQLYDKLGNNFSARNLPITDFDKGELTTLIFQLPKFANTTADSSGQGSTGNCTNMGLGGANNTCSFELLGKSGSAMNFDGMNDYVNVSDSAVFDNIFLEGTITAWIRVVTSKSANSFFTNSKNRTH